MTGIVLTEGAYDLDAEGLGAVVHGARARQMLHPGRGASCRPHEGYAQARRGLTDVVEIEVWRR